MNIVKNKNLGLRTKDKKKLANTKYKILNTATTTILFPQISRKITANFKILAILVLLLWLGLNLFPSFSSTDNLKTAVLKNLKRSDFHLALANQLLKNNQINEAEKEILYALQFSPDNKNLKEKLKEIKEIKNKPVKLRKEIQKWEKIVQDKPDYRDGYFQLAILHYQLYENKKAKEYLEKTLSLDPNFSPGKKLRRLIN